MVPDVPPLSVCGHRRDTWPLACTLGVPLTLAARRCTAIFLAVIAALCLVGLAGCGVSPTGQSPQPCVTSAVGPVRALDVSGAVGIASIAVVDSLHDLKRKSAVILIGTVRQTCALQIASGSIYTDATVRVDRLVFDPAHRVAGTTVVVRVPGGQIGRFGEQVEDQPTFHPSERYVLFLTLDPGGQGRYASVDGIQGALRVQSGIVATLTATAPVSESDFIAQIEQA